jgi:BirA family biotin operon repressor/biotin-[acetyl-CoA-carboxylase] ligase
MEFHITWHERLGSTSHYLKDAVVASAGVVPGTLVAAREQTDGRGRRGRPWVSGPGSNLTFSFYLEADHAPEHAASLPMAVALGIQDALGAHGVAATLKWPNDLLVKGRKLCGILAETAGPGLVAGVGLNVNMTGEEAAAIDQPATSVLMETGQRHSPERMLEAVVEGIRPWVDRWLASGFSGLAEAWASRYPGVGSPVSVRQHDERLSGVLVGFGAKGQLILRGDDGQTREVWAGELD